MHTPIPQEKNGPIISENCPKGCLWRNKLDEHEDHHYSNPACFGGLRW